MQCVPSARLAGWCLGGKGPAGGPWRLLLLPKAAAKAPAGTSQAQLPRWPGLLVWGPGQLPRHSHGHLKLLHPLPFHLFRLAEKLEALLALKVSEVEAVRPLWRERADGDGAREAPARRKPRGQRRPGKSGGSHSDPSHPATPKSCPDGGILGQPCHRARRDKLGPTTSGRPFAVAMMPGDLMSTLLGRSRGWKRCKAQQSRWASPFSFHPPLCHLPHLASSTNRGSPGEPRKRLLLLPETEEALLHLIHLPSTTWGGAGKPAPQGCL